MRRESENVKRKMVEARNETRENTMIRHKFILSSFIFALFSSASAIAQVDPDCAGANPGTVTCPGPNDTPAGPAVYADGITHATNGGDLTVNVGDGVTSFGTGGFNTTATGDDSITMTKGDSASMSTDATIGTRATAVIGATAEAGDISVTTGAGVVTGAFDFVEYGVQALTDTGNIALDLGRVNAGGAIGEAGIQAISTGSGNIDIVTAGASARNSVGNLPDGGRGLEAITDGGNINIISTGGIGAASGTLGGTGNRALRVRGGLLAQSTGAGEIDLNLNSAQSSGFDETTIEARTGTGDITINVSSLTARGGTGIVTHTDGLATVTMSGSMGGGGRSNTTSASVAMRSTGAGDVIVNITGGSDTDFNLLQDYAKMEAPFDFSGLGGAATLNFASGSAWVLPDPDSVEGDFSPRNTLSAGDDFVTLASGAVLSTPSQTAGNFNSWGFPIPLGGTDDEILERGEMLPPEQLRFAADFGDGDDTLELGGGVLVNPAVDVIDSDKNLSMIYPGELRLDNLETLRYSATMWMGALFGDIGFGNNGDFSRLTDSTTDDIFSAPGAHFQGMVDESGQALGRIIVDVELGKTGQAGCNIEYRAENGDLPVTDCVDLRGGSAGGRTLFVLNQKVPGDRGAYNPEGSVLVDVSGGNAAENDPLAFAIAPETPQYSELADGTGVIDKGLFFYTIAYDPDSEQYQLYGLPGTGSQQFPLLRQAANSLWRTSTNAWFDRQVDQRDVDLGAGVGRGVWLRTTLGSVERDITTPIVGGGETFEFDNSYTQDEDTTTIGWDVISRDGSGGSWLVGGMLGYARGKLTYDGSRNTANLEGMTAGAYTSLTKAGFYLDAALNLTWLDVDNDVPALALFPETAILQTEARSTGGRLEAGYRIMLGPVGIEPLAGLSWVKTKLDDISIPADDPNRFGGRVQFKSSTANNASAGLRLSMEDLLSNVAPTGLSLTVRAIDQANGRAEASIENLGPLPAVTSDDLEGSYTQLTGSVNVTSPSKALAGYLNFDVLTGDDYDSNSISAGLRYQW